jgi:hypothetical protein
MAAETMENELKTLRQIARDLNMVPEGNRNTPSIQVLYMDGLEDMPYAYRSIKSLAAVEQVMAATPTESTQVDTNRVTPAHNRNFTE